jgi:hypothetical protein
MRLLSVLVAPVVVIGGLAIAPTAEADCTSTGGTTICAQGTSRGANTGQGPSGGSGPSVPYPCDYDWYCDDDNWGVNFDVDWNPGIGAPGRPPNRPGGGGGRPGGGGGGRPGRG